MDKAALGQAIRCYVEHGLAVIPLQIADKLPPLLVIDGEERRMAWKPFAVTRPNLSQWKAWWRRYAPCNIGLVLATSEAPDGKQLVCVDCDCPEQEEWVCRHWPQPPTPMVRTSRGLHRYFYAPAELQHFPGDEDKPELPEVRAGTHYGLLPPSIHPDGTIYEWIGGLEWGEVMPADLPAWGIDLMGKSEVGAAPGKPVKVSDATGSAYGLAALQRETDELAAALEHTRNNKLNEAAFALGQLIAGGQLAEADVAAALRGACERNGWIPQYGDSAFVGTLRSGLTAGKLQPRAPEPRPAGQPRTSALPAAQVAPQDPEASEPDGYDDALLADAERAVNAVQTYQSPPSSRGGFRPAADFAEKAILETEERRTLPKGIYGLRTGWPTVDRHFGGLKWQQLILIMGSSGTGKTTLMYHPVCATVEWLLMARSDAVCVVRQLEGGVAQYMHAWGCYHYGLPLWAFHPGGNERSTPEQVDLVARTYAEFPTLPIEFSEDTDLDRMMGDIQRRVGQGPVEAIFLDNIQDLTGSDGKWGAITRGAGLVKEFCRETGIPFVALSQTNHHKGQPDSGRGGPEWFNAASLVFSLRRGTTATQSIEEALRTNMTRLTSRKERWCLYGMLPETLLKMNLPTKRLWEETEYERLFGAQTVEAEEAIPWHSNG
jgi:hypothetical protein